MAALLHGAAGAAPPSKPIAPRPATAFAVTVTDGAGKPVEGAIVTVLGIERVDLPGGVVDPARVRSALSARDGRAHIDSPPSGPWTVAALARGYAPAVLRRVARGPLSIRLEKGGAITGSVRDGETGRPVAGARVSVPAATEVPRGGWEEEALRNVAVSDAQGRFRLEGIGRSPLRLTARAPGFATANQLTTAAPTTARNTRKDEPGPSGGSLQPPLEPGARSIERRPIYTEATAVPMSRLLKINHLRD